MLLGRRTKQQGAGKKNTTPALSRRLLTILGAGGLCLWPWLFSWGALACGPPAGFCLCLGGAGQLLALAPCRQRSPTLTALLPPIAPACLSACLGFVGWGGFAPISMPSPPMRDALSNVQAVLLSLLLTTIWCVGWAPCGSCGVAEGVALCGVAPHVPVLGWWPTWHPKN